jgi:quercetin dioxygenase-like cupin family protein
MRTIETIRNPVTTMKRAQSSGRHRTGVLSGQITDPESLPWNPRMALTGISLQHLVTGASGGRRLSLHHVRIDPGCATGNHVHAGMVEIHDVPAGAGTWTRAGTVISCTPGVTGIMPADQVHRVGAGERGCSCRQHSLSRACEVLL